MTGKQRAQLRGMANTLETILYIGKEALTELCERTGAEPIQFIGRRFVLYRASRENPRITLDA